MSEELYDGKINLTSFYGGEKRGPCIQMFVNSTQGKPIDFEKDEIKKIIKVLQRWLKNVSK